MKIRLPGTRIEVSLRDKMTLVEFRDNDGRVLVRLETAPITREETLIIPLEGEASLVVETCAKD